MEVDGQGAASVLLPPGKRAGTHYTGGWVGPMDCLDGCGKFHPQRNFFLTVTLLEFAFYKAVSSSV
jgi:hypothetical protein